MALSIDSRQLKRTIRKGMRKVRAAGLVRTATRVAKRSRTFRRLMLGPMADVASDVSVLFDLVNDYASGRYREVPRRTIFAAVFALLYVLDPVDLIPDFIPGFGYVDDMGVVLLVVRAIRRDLDDYRSWGQKLARQIRHWGAASL